jgi:DNA-binding response OmpR family regulator
VRAVHVLVVEDYKRFRNFVCMLLQQSGGFQISEASDGLEAVQKFRELKPDLILLDIGLPQVNGLEVARRLGPTARALFLSQESSSDVVHEALGIGAGYVYKPDALSELLPAIKAVLEGKQYVSSSLESLERTVPQNTQAIAFSFRSLQETDEAVDSDRITLLQRIRRQS